MTKVHFLLAEPADIRTVVETDAGVGEITRAEAEAWQAAGVPIEFIDVDEQPNDSAPVSERKARR